MLYKAIVIDNSSFFRDGTVRVRVAGHYMGNIAWNLSDNYPEEVENGELPLEDQYLPFNYNQDFNAAIMSSMGGGRNYGTFVLPQINETGVISFLGDNLRRPVWMGSLFEPTRDDSFNVEYANIPSDKMEAEGPDSDGLIAGEHNLDAESQEDALKKNIIIRTKSTFRGDDADSVDWQQRPTTNIITVGAKEVKAVHFDEKDGWDETTPKKYQTFKISKNQDDKESIRLEIKNDTDDKESSLELSEEGMKLFVRDGEDENIFNITSGDDGITFLDQYGNSIIGNSDGLEVKDENDNIITTNSGGITIDGGGDINLKASNIIIDSNEVQLNGTGDTAVRFSKLESIITEFENHIHITQGPAGPTSPAMKAPAIPISGAIVADKNTMESRTVKVK